ncbi:hypothetical protein N9563_00290 [bacterium]|nr:hypothetical protein [bacterium]
MQETSPSTFSNWKEVLKTEIGFLFCQKVTPDLNRLGNYYLALGFFTAWLAGVGRYWDNPRAEIWQYAGFGSVAYILIMAGILWLFILPLRPHNWSYKTVLIFVGMTSPPAILYAIPVELYFSLDMAQLINVLFLGLVALWRVLLLFRFLIYSARLTGLAIFVAGLLPLTLIVTILTALNLEHVVFSIMGGLAPENVSPNDASYGILLLITFFSILAFPITLILCFFQIIYQTIQLKKNKPQPDE